MVFEPDMPSFKGDIFFNDKMMIVAVNEYAYIFGQFTPHINYIVSPNNLKVMKSVG